MSLHVTTALVLSFLGELAVDLSVLPTDVFLMNVVNENEHYVSRVLLERFKLPGKALQCFDVKTATWKPRSVARACAAGGYNQLLQGPHADHTLEEALSKIESRLPKTFKALERAAEGGPMELPEKVYDNLCWYCAFLKLCSLPSKASAVVNFVYQLNFELQSGHHSLLRELEIPEEVINSWKAACAAGYRVIVDSQNVLQLIYRNQFLRVYAGEFGMFRDTQWAVSKSPIELPVSDVGLVPLYLQTENANHYILPIGPLLLLEGIFFLDLTKNAPRRPLKRLTLNEDDAHYIRDAVCASAVVEIICSRRISEVPACLARASTRRIRFHTIVNPRVVQIAGLEPVATELRFRVVPLDEYVAFVHSFVKPPADP